MPTLATSMLELAPLIPTLPFLSMLICGLLCFSRKPALQRSAAWITIAAIAGAFAVSLGLLPALGTTTKEVGSGAAEVVGFFQWIRVGGFQADFSFYVDPLTVVMLLVVTGVGLLITIYAAGYMAGDRGYSRFFTYISLFIFAMTTLVMADNLLLLYLGWEGVGLASYLLIGFYYRKPSAVAAAKKAFIVNRVGDASFALGLMATFMVFGTIQYAELLPAARDLTHTLAEGNMSGTLGASTPALLAAIPFLLMLGAFGKSAQLPLHVWLPDAMEGPTPVSALIHAATMVTAGVYMIARLMPLFLLNPVALDVVAVVGGVTALFAALIALGQNDIKRIWAYSTISQLGYMFLGIGVMASSAAIFHLFTHAFFKALLFLTAGSVMHAMAGQLDIRKMSGLGRRMPITAALMLVGCLALAGFPLITSGFFSKDQILTNALVHWPVLGWLGIATALLTAFYTFRVWFRIFPGPERFTMGGEHHGYPVEPQDASHMPSEPHEMKLWPINAPLVLLALGALAGGAFGGFISDMIAGSTAAVSEQTKAAALGLSVTEYAQHYAHTHHLVSVVAGGGAVVMIALAAWLHWRRRDLGDRIAAGLGVVGRLAANKFYVDEIYEALVRIPLRVLAWICYAIDSVIVDGLVVDTLLGQSPRWLGQAARPLQRGALQSYASTMLVGLVIILFVVLWLVLRMTTDINL